MYSGSSCKQTSTTQESVGYLREWFPYAGTRGVRVKWPLVVDCLAIKKTLGMKKAVSQCLAILLLRRHSNAVTGIKFACVQTSPERENFKTKPKSNS